MKGPLVALVASTLGFTAFWPVQALAAPIVLTPVFEAASRESPSVVANAIYLAAKECWARPRTLFRAGVNIEYLPGDSSIQILVKFQSSRHMQSVHPLFALNVRPVEAGSSIQALGWDRKFPDKRMFEEDSKRWAAGDYTCSDTDA